MQCHICASLLLVGILSYTCIAFKTRVLRIRTLPVKYYQHTCIPESSSPLFPAHIITGWSPFCSSGGSSSGRSYRDSEETAGGRSSHQLPELCKSCLHKIALVMHSQLLYHSCFSLFCIALYVVNTLCIVMTVWHSLWTEGVCHTLCSSPVSPLTSHCRWCMSNW